MSNILAWWCHPTNNLIDLQYGLYLNSFPSTHPSTATWNLLLSPRSRAPSKENTSCHHFQQTYDFFSISGWQKNNNAFSQRRLLELLDDSHHHIYFKEHLCRKKIPEIPGFELELNQPFTSKNSSFLTHSSCILFNSSTERKSQQQFNRKHLIA